MAALHFIGNKVRSSYGSRYVWLLYTAGALAGSVSMNYFMPYDTIPIPKVGADPCISAFFSFLATLNPKTTLFNFIVPVRIWFLLLCSIGFVIVSDSSNKNLGGLAMGFGLGILRRSSIVWF